MTTYHSPYSFEELPIEPHRYRLVQARACPFAHRTTIARELLGLDEVISLATVDSVHSPEEGWLFRLDENNEDPVLKVKDVKSLYLNTDATYEGPYTVPALVDTDSKKVVMSESLDLLRLFSTRFQPLHQKTAIDLYPKHLAEEIDTWNQAISDQLLIMSYKIGYAEEQADYEKYVQLYFDFLDQIEEKLAKNRYLLGEQLTESDLVLYTPLIRLEVAYKYIFSILKKSIRTDYPNIMNYMRELYQIPAFRNSTDFEAIKAGYYTGTLGQRSFKREIVPVGPDMSWLNELHHRDK